MYKHSHASNLEKFKPDIPHGFGEIIFKTLEILERMYGSLNITFYNLNNFQFVMADISFNIAWKEMEIVQIAPVTINSFNFGI